VPLGRLIDRRPIPPVAAAIAAGAYGVIVSFLGLQGTVPGIILILVSSIVALAFTLMMVQVTISEVARPELRATGLGGYGTALSAGLGIGPFVAGGVSEASGFGWGFGVIGAIGLAVAMVAAVVLAGTRRRPSAIVFPE